ncbi:hypothetical protein BJX96DRAFT_165317 [Aspergillus floccosus]
MDGPPYPLEKVLRVACQHPFYNRDARYPPSREMVHHLEKEGYAGSGELDIADFPVITKTELAQVISRLMGDDSPDNAYRHQCYATITGGGFKRGTPLLWLTDSIENRHNRVASGKLVREMGVMEPTDVVLNLHVSGHFYRSLDMTTDILEHAGATVLPAGSEMSSELVVEALMGYCITCLAGPVTELIRIAMHISQLSRPLCGQLKIRKLFYTSEPLSSVQEAFLKHIFGPVTIYSGLGSAEIGFWGVGNPCLTESPSAVNARDYIFDTRNMLVEILPSDAVGTTIGGHITVTSLQRLRNPLVRYNCGDIGSVHQLPAAARRHVPAEEVEHYRVLRMYGRDPRLTFTWRSKEFDYGSLFAILQSPGWNILQSQVVLDDRQGGEQLEIRLMRGYGLDGEIPDENVTSELCRIFSVSTDASFRVIFVSDLSALERSSTGQKVIRFVDKRKGCSGTGMCEARHLA